MLDRDGTCKPCAAGKKPSSNKRDCEVAKCTIKTGEAVQPSFKYKSKHSTGEITDYAHQLAEGKTFGSSHCYAFLGYQMFDFRLLDTHMREAPTAGLFESADVGAKGFFETILCKNNW